MLLKKIKSTSNGTRHQIILCKNLLIKYNYLLKTFNKGLKQQSGRCKLTGTITVRHHGGGNKTLIKNLINDKNSFISIVLGVFYYSLRSAFLFLNFDLLKSNYFFSLATDKIMVGSVICNNFTSFDFRLGYRCYLNQIPTGSLIHSLPNKSNSKVKIIRSAGTYGQLIQKTTEFAIVKLPSAKIVTIPSVFSATIGRISNVLHNKLTVGKAGKTRKSGIRPSVRGIAMNPVDHPHGGRTNGGRTSVTPWGLPTKNYPTVKTKKYE